ncbi:ABC transporter ATP-binding protein [Shouchella lehensis]|uniref:ABC transporter ATP-binding protein n=1 Tax=Shouchella lehensis TaxID=300825 RepID=A0A4Y7WLQ2_9BACI|nr:ABC transporter ATP-binding protein [Shouchella lehensis]MBG9783152.1 hypothetical protein [Shouchella lehensis]TES49483.1 ABC transporter ATP-binding protein [Shouchella lehensis]
MELSIDVKGISYAYNIRKKRNIALNDINFSVKKGSIFGLIGPNGAGKSTLIKLMSTLLTPQEGHIEIMGKDIIKDKKEIRRNISLIYGGESGLYWKLTAMENMMYFGELNSVKDYRSKSEEIFKLVGLYDARHNQVSSFSKGMKQRLHIARGLLNNPSIIFMDEPTLGLDVEISLRLREIIKNLSVEHGKTIIYTSHYMKEVEMLCDEIGFISKGEMLKIDNPDNLKKEMQNNNIFTLDFDFFNDKDLEKLNQDKRILNYVINEKRLEIETGKDFGLHDLLKTHIQESEISNISVQEYDIENVYMDLLKAKG